MQSSEVPAPLYVARPLLPRLEDLHELLKDIWDSKVVTNEGPYHNKLESILSKHLEVPVAKLFNNGTIGLMAAILALELPKGSEIITTPLTFAATAHAIKLCGHTPVFADILSDALTIDPAAVEAAITDKTSAVLAVHVYGTICETAALQDICDKNGLALIYDAAHAFGGRIDGRSVASLGDLSVFSLHATKLFTTLEGGIVTSNTEEMAKKLRWIRNFGIKNEHEVVDIGLNGKMNELQAAIGILNLPLVESELQARRALGEKYNEMISKFGGIRPKIYQPNVVSSEQYYPIVVDAAAFGRSRDDLYDALKIKNIFSRKYFYPTCTDFVPYKDYKIHSTSTTPVIEKRKGQLLCLPFHSGVTDCHVEVIASVFNSR